MTQVMTRVEEINQILQAGEPGNISVDEHSGYTGYKPQAVIDALNAIIPLGGWGFEELSSEVVSSDKGGLAISQVRVWLKDVDFQPTGWGQNRVTRGDIGDAKKGAQTDAIKKALSYFSIGNRAYHGLLKAGNGNPTKTNPTQIPPRPKTPPQAPQTAHSNGTSHNSPGEQKATSQPSGGHSEANNGDARMLQSVMDEVKQLGIAANTAQWMAWKKGVLGADIPNAKLSHDQIVQLQADVEQRKQANESAA